MTTSARDRASRIELLVLDCDGVLTDGSITYSEAPGGGYVESKTFNVRDGLGLRVWRRLGLQAASVTGRGGEPLRRRATELGIEHVIEGVSDKNAAIRDLCKQLGVAPDLTAAMGDDWPDLPMFRTAGYAISPADAHDDLRKRADLVTNAAGGRGAVREAIEHLLDARDLLTDARQRFERGPSERSM